MQPDFGMDEPATRIASENAAPRAPEMKGARPRGRDLLATGGLLGALAASSCCIAPLAFFSLGATGAWIGNLAALAPYQPIFVTVTLAFLAAGFYLVYRKPGAAGVVEDAACSRRSDRVVKVALVSATILVAAAVAFPYVAPALLGG